MTANITITGEVQQLLTHLGNLHAATEQLRQRGAPVARLDRFDRRIVRMCQLGGGFCDLDLDYLDGLQPEGFQPAPQPVIPPPYDGPNGVP